MQDQAGAISFELDSIGIVTGTKLRADHAARSVTCPQPVQEWLLGLLDATPGLVMVWNSRGRLYYLNARGRSMLGIPPSDDLAAYRISDFFSARGYEKYLKQSVPACLETGVWHGETTLLDRYDHEVPVSQLLLAHCNENTRSEDRTVFSSIAWDIGDQKRTEHSLRHQATHDALTGLPNRTLLVDRLKQAVRAARRYGHGVGVLFLDVDNFKALNDDFGHEPANGVLRSLAKRLKTCTRAEDTVARYGGDEFVLLLPKLLRAEDSRRVVKKIEKALDEPFFVNGRWVEVTASIGVAAYPEDGEEVAALLHKADSTMYRLKRAAKPAASRPRIPRQPLYVVT